ncbi:formylglycine-generating enzyme family protein [Bizionia sediminis]|uniref:Formylglycine-generating enzyme family protein n=1 Tax=Bizionia sediminis TaxID=1737064 RepID=A0ABW5KRW5_9FLAO
MKTNIFSLFIVCVTFQWFAFGQAKEMVFIEGSRYIPLYGRDSTVVEVKDFFMDVYPVSVADFNRFLEQHPNWKKSHVKGLFADKSYLPNWETTLADTETNNAKKPVTSVSWFAAKSYCEAQGKRLPTVDEWEYVAMADETTKDARIKADYNERILAWYEAPKKDFTIGNTPKNIWGVADLHGLVWEWTLDFNSVLITGESRKDTDKDANLFCGSAALNATDLMNYAAFMRYATRGSLKAKNAMKNMGFRCVKDAQPAN